MSSQYNSSENEIYLKEIFAILWSHKTLILVITCFSIFIAGYYAVTAQKKFTATAIFQIDKGSQGGISLPGELGALASFAGLGDATDSSTEILLERIRAREFILKVSEKASLIDDPFFNTYDPNYVDPVWKATIKKLIGWQPLNAEKDKIIEDEIIRNFKKFVSANSSTGGAISVSVTHREPEYAARYANQLMNEMQQLTEFEAKKTQQLRLSYLSEILADAVQEVENAEQNLKEFALNNSANAQENFLVGSLQLDQLRMERSKVGEISKVLSILKNVVLSENLENTSHEAFRKAYPIVDDVSFRRILGMSETISAWDWPEIDTILAVSATLKDRQRRLDVEIKNIEDSAKVYAASAEDLMKLTRDAKVAEAAYTVLIEQVKSQSLAAGFQAETFKVFEYATPPLGPSSPKRNIVLVLGAIVGLFVGSGIALINSIRRGVYYTRVALEADARPNLSLKSRSFRRLSRSSINQIKSYISKKQILEVDEAEIKIAKEKLIYILNCGGKSTASGAARLLATQSSESGRRIVLCDRSGQSDRDFEGKPKKEISGISIVKLDENINLTEGKSGAKFFSSSNLQTAIEELMKNFDQVFICAETKEAIMGLIALKDFNPSVIMLTKIRNTRKRDIKKIKSIQPINILFYD